MKRFLHANRARRLGHDGWALQVRGAARPLDWTVSTTRAEVRELRKELPPDLFERVEVVKVRINVEALS